MITFTKEQLIASAHARIEFAEMMLSGELEPLKERTWSIELKLARIALASLEAEKCAEPVAFINGAWTLVYYRPPKELGLKIGDKLYAAPPAQMLEIENLEHFISFWKKVQAGQMKPGKNDIDHTVWFLEGLSNLTAPPAPVAVPDEMTMQKALSAIDRLSWQECTRDAYMLGWNACRAAMLNQEKSNG
ncbi:hypothetical protein [Enterobacter asburiae]|uniref:hypothetical protein n=1 Tax=Enterobacter asburiae TaxID=61645 RepID=UPI0010CA3922|nr:hypothetical protein [Enterobacter asburiae]BBJ62270.1 hypothetical protein EAS1808013_012510 [Enterobacter asburiae]